MDGKFKDASSVYHMSVCWGLETLTTCYADPTQYALVPQLLQNICPSTSEKLLDSIHATLWIIFLILNCAAHYDQEWIPVNNRKLQKELLQAFFNIPSAISPWWDRGKRLSCYLWVTLKDVDLLLFCFYAESFGKTNRDKETTETAEHHTEIQEHVHGKLFMQLINIRHYWKKFYRDRRHLEIEIKCPS